MRIVVSLGLLVGAAHLLVGCCGYGGPGCGDPGLELCASQVAVGETRTTLLYTDDTGAHPSTFGAVSAAPADRLTARAGSEVGEIILVGSALGSATLTVRDAEGWPDRAFSWPLHVAADVDPAPTDGDFCFLLPIADEAP